MEQGFSLYNPAGSLNFDLQNIKASGDDEEEEAIEEAKQKEKELQDALATAFDDLESDNEDQYTHYSDNSAGADGDTDVSRLNQNSDCHSFINSKNDFQEKTSMCDGVGRYNNDVGNVLHFENQQTFGKDSIYCSTSSSDGQQSNFSVQEHLNKENCAGDTNEQVTAEGYTNPASKNHNFEESTPHEDHKGHDFTKKHIFNANEEEYIKLQVLYKARGNELQRLNKEMDGCKADSERDVRILKHQLALMEGEKDGLLYSLQQSQQLYSNINQENSTLKGKLNAVELQLSAEHQSKENIIKKLENAEATIQSLEQQVMELTCSENLARAREQHESVLNNLKLRNQQEMLQLKEEIDRLMQQLNSVVHENKSLNQQIHQLEQQCQQMQIDKAETVNRLALSLESSQRQCQHLLESGTIAEASKLKLQMQHLMEENVDIEKENKNLKEEVNLLTLELKSCEATNLLFSDDFDAEGTPVHFGIRKKDLNRQKNPNDLLTSLQTELEKSLNVLQSQRKVNTSLRSQLSSLKKELSTWVEKANTLGNRLESAEKKLNEYQIKISELCPEGSIPLSKHQKEITAVDNENNNLTQQLKEIQARLLEVSENEEKLNEMNRQLRHEMSEMMKANDNDKRIALQNCRESNLQLHEDAMERLTQELRMKYESEKEKICFDYTNHISALEKENTLLNDSLHEVKNQYIKICEENKKLHSSIMELEQFKSNKSCEIEKRMKKEYEKNLKIAKTFLERENNEHLEVILKQELIKAQEQWAKQKIKDVENFICDVRQQLDNEFQERLQKEQEVVKNALRDNEMLTEQFNKKIYLLKCQWEDEKSELIKDLKEKLQKHWENEIQNLQQAHESQIEKLRQNFEQKISMLRSENGKESLKSETNFSDIQKLKQEILQERQLFEKIKSSCIETEKVLKEKMKIAEETEKRLRERLSRYEHRNEISSKKHNEQLQRLRFEMEDLRMEKNIEKETEIKKLKEQYAVDILTIEKRLKEIQNRDYVKTSNSHCQTEELLFSKSDLFRIHDMMLNTLRKISGIMSNYLAESQKRVPAKLKIELMEYHKQIEQQLFPDMNNPSTVKKLFKVLKINESGDWMQNNNTSEIGQDNNNSSVDFYQTVPKTIASTSHKYSDTTSKEVFGTVSTSELNTNLDFFRKNDSHEMRSPSAKSDATKKYLNIPEQRSSTNFLSHVLKLPALDLSSKLCNADLCEALKAYFPEKLSSS